MFVQEYQSFQSDKASRLYVKKDGVLCLVFSLTKLVYVHGDIKSSNVLLNCETGQVTSKIDAFAFWSRDIPTDHWRKNAIITQDRREILLPETVVYITEKAGAEAELDSFIDLRLKCGQSFPCG
ncbi:hypothetical protein V6N12_040514 [Hibiscus sabdariffa]|uniref:Protein kinase domain-containing protein n=1 Tax=Hibiscus sabdariffa TaxID=183260 RepID=A0ABR2E3W5_9ROSI